MAVALIVTVVEFTPVFSFINIFSKMYLSLLWTLFVMLWFLVGY